ncbi:MAG TPA: hypothetical protein VND91_07575 [Candidatus Saccharimonadia bacterium]|nr:hypothetical protein [Candidatus Saccharimonadia bacterium]
MVDLQHSRRAAWFARAVRPLAALIVFGTCLAFAVVAQDTPPPADPAPAESAAPVDAPAADDVSAAPQPGAPASEAMTDAATPASAASSHEPATLTAERAPLAPRSLVLDLADGPNRAIAVGERGHILVSEDRREWRQVDNVPTRSALTGVAIVGDRAWAVGHDGVILASTDGGLTWTRQRAQPYDPALDELHNGVPLLDVWFADQTNGIAIGAYALMLKTSDGGATWTQQALQADSARAGADPEATAEPADAAAADDAGDDAGDETHDSWTFSDEDLALEEETDPHLNAIARTGDGSLFIVAERGTAFRSTDGGATWSRIKLPYPGSMFGVIGYDGRHVLAYGLRGHAFESTDLGDNWTEVETGTELSLLGGTGWPGGGAALVGANGIVLTRSAAGSGLLAHTHPDGVVLSSAIALAPNGELVVGGENGVSLYKPQ